MVIGAQRTAGRHALVRRLEGAGTPGSAMFICTNKNRDATGEGQRRDCQIYLMDFRAVRRIGNDMRYEKVTRKKACSEAVYR
jgi:hypothetical protein